MRITRVLETAHAEAEVFRQKAIPFFPLGAGSGTLGGLGNREIKDRKMAVSYTEVLDALRELTSRERVDFLPLAPDQQPLSSYPPIAKYLLDLKNAAKPETAAEDLFTAL